MSISDLWFACVSKNIPEINRLISIGVDVNGAYSGYSILSIACKNSKLKEVEIVKILIDAGADVNLESASCENPIMLAVESKNDLLIELLLESGADPGILCFRNYKPIHYAYSVKILKLLISYGADIEAQNKHRKTILHYACERGDVDIVRYLVNECGANINVKDNLGNIPRPIRTDLSWEEYSAITEILDK